ncbi:MAG TPA: MBG domain-containing protein [Flavitalea sp.]|nr:MBG domain-containing protein [Flavitalea sp.]
MPKATILHASPILLRNKIQPETKEKLKHILGKSLMAVSIAASLCIPCKNLEAQVQFTSTPVTAGVEKLVYSYSLSASETNNNPLTFSATTIPSWLTLTQGQNSSTQVGGTISDVGGVAGDAYGNIYASELSGTIIYKITPDGTTTAWATKTGNSYGMAANGNYLYVGKFTGSCDGISIVRYQLNNPGAGPETVLNQPDIAAGMSMIFKDGYLYFSSFACSKIGRVNLSNLQFENYITSGLPYAGPWGLGFATNGDLYVATWSHNTLLKYASGTTTNPVVVLSGLPVATSDVKIDDNGYVYVSFYGSGVRKYAPDFSSYVTIAATGLIWGMALSSQGTLVYGDASASKVYKLETGAVLTGTPSHKDVGDHAVKINVSNGTTSVDQEFIITVTDPNPPLVETYSPVHMTQEIVLDTTLSLEFDETIVKGTGYIYVKSVVTDEILQTINIDSSIVSIDDSIITIKVTGLPVYTNMYIAIDAGAIKDVNNNDFAGISNATTWSFVTIAKTPQIISFAATDEMVYGTNDYVPGASSDASLEITYTSSDETVATIVSGTIHILKTGQTVITASQTGNDDYLAATPVDQTLNIVPKEITLSLLATPAVAKIYDGNEGITLKAENYSLTGVINDEDVSVTGTAIFSGSDAGNNKTILVNNFVIAGLNIGNYYLSTTSATVTGTISPKSIELELISQPAINKIYDGNNSASLVASNYNLLGIVGSDEVGVTATSVFDDRNAGIEKTITANAFILSGADKNNYSLLTSTATVKGTIIQKEISITGITKTKVYGSADPGFTYNVSGLITGDKMSGSLTRVNNKNVGQYPITIGTLTAGANYHVVQYTSASLTITPAPLTISAEDKAKQQGNVNPALTFRYDGLMAGDSPADLTSMPQAQTSATTLSPIGYYEISTNGASSGNYTISFVKGKLSVMPEGKTHLKVWTSSTNVLQIRVYSETVQKVKLSLFTQTGQPLIQEQKQLQVGINSFTMAIGTVASGVYVLGANADKFEEAQKVKIK